MARNRKHEPIAIDEWIEQDLTAQAAKGALAPAFEVDAVVRQVEEVLAGEARRTPVVTGPNGIGKSAVIHEVLRRAAAGGGAEVLRERRVLQISFKAIAGRYKDKAQATTFIQHLFDQLIEEKDPPILFVRDIHVASPLDWEAPLHRYLSRSQVPMLAEGLGLETQHLLQYWPDLAEVLVPLPIEEPRVEVVLAIVKQWCDWQKQRSGREVAPEAQRSAVELAARFMGHLCFPRKALDLLRQTLDLCDAPRVGLREVVARFSQITRVPTSLVDPDAPLDLAEVQQFLAGRLLGQDEAVDAVLRMISLIKAGLADLRRPFGVFLFVGPTGVGKTHTAQLLAEYLFGDRNRLIRINMADYAAEHHVGVLFGNVYGSNAEQQRGVLSTRLLGHPFGVLLLDEFEKAHPKVHDAFLQLMDEGRFINGRSETVSATSLIVIATSNAGATVYRETGLGFGGPMDARALDLELDRRLMATFRFEFLNRFDRVVHFHPLDRTHIRGIAERELFDLARRHGLEGRQLGLEVDVDVLDWLVANGYHPHYGARFLRREIERHVTGALADFVVRQRPPVGSKLRLAVRRDRVDVRLAEAPAPVITVQKDERAVPLDREELLSEARGWVARFLALASESRRRQEEAQALVQQSSESGFWDDPIAAQAVLQRYKTLDARLQVEGRLLHPSRDLERALDENAPLERIARLVEDVAASWRRWNELGTEEASSGAWLLIGPADPLQDAPAWIEELARMYLGWCKRKALTAEVVAEQVHNGELQRVVLEVDGPGAAPLLEMEHGQHRRRAADGRVERAIVEVLPRGEGPAGEVPGARIEDARHGEGKLLTRRTARLRVVVPTRGLVLQFVGVDRDVLTLLARDLVPVLGAAPGDIEIARTYGITGGTARDPRTAAASATVKDVMRGHLEVFWRAWQSR